MNIRDNKGINLISLTVTILILLVITGAMIFNTKNGLSVREVNALRNDIEVLKSKVDDYYLKYGELPILCNYSNKEQLINVLRDRANDRGSTLNNPWTNNDNVTDAPINPDDSSEYVVIDLEKLGGFTLNYGYDTNGEYFTIKNRNPASVERDGNGIPKESVIFIINTKTHQIYFPHGIFADNIMYYTF